MAALCLGISIQASVAGGQGGSAKPMQMTAQQKTQADWHAQLLQTPAGTQCREATFPATTWQNVPCAAAGSVKDTPFLRAARILRPMDEHASGNYTAQSNGSISSATGSLYQLSNLGAGGQPGAYSVQMNTNGFPSTFCKGTTNAGCVGIEQFVLDSNGHFFIQTWLLSYLDGKTTQCPAAFTWKVDSGVNCWRNAVYSAWTAVPIGQLSGMTLTAQTSASGNETVTISVAGHSYSTPQTNTQMGLSGHWNNVDFNLFGENSKQEAFFNIGTLGAVAVNLNDGTSNAPACAGQGAGGAKTLETTNLTLGACSGSGKVGTLNPGIYFYESVPPTLRTISSTSGSAKGGEKLTITGQGFTGGVSVKFGNTYASGNTACTGGTTCTVTTPPGAGTVPVTVANLSSIGAEGAFSPAAGAPTYQFKPVPTGRMSPAGGAPGTTVTITGTNFSTAPGGTQVVFTLRGAPMGANNVQCTSTTRCTLFAPGFAEIANVPVPSTAVVIVNGESSSLGSFTYQIPSGPPVKTPPVNCEVCRQNGQTCKVVNGINVCVGAAR